MQRDAVWGVLHLPEGVLIMLSAQATHADKHDDEAKKLLEASYPFMLSTLSAQATHANQTDHHEFIIEL